MEKLLLKLARQLNSLDEASLMSLWDKYAAEVQHFEPSKRWEEYVLILNLIQSMRWKNQLFNCRWAATLARGSAGRPLAGHDMPPVPPLEDLPAEENGDSGSKPARRGVKAGAKVLAFRPPKDDQPS